MFIAKIGRVECRIRICVLSFTRRPACLVWFGPVVNLVYSTFNPDDDDDGDG